MISDLTENISIKHKYQMGISHLKNVDLKFNIR